MRTIDAVIWQKLIETGEVRCRGCDEFIDLSDCENINDGVAVWNSHVSECPATNDEDAEPVV